MKTELPHVARWLRCLALTCLAFLSCLRATAQTGTGTVQGRVYNPAAQSYVRNAEVRLEGTNQVVFTENDGSFTFTNVPAGEASVSVTFVGYNPAKDTFTVAAGATAVREINLTSTAATSPAAGKDGVVQLSAFTVSSEREGNAKAIQAQRRDMNIVTSVSSDLFGDVADGNVGEFLKYLPGIDLDYVESEPRGPRLGGMDGQYVGVAFDGMRTASADANRGGDGASRATSFEGFSITSVESIEVNWTSSSENDGDTPAGNVNMRSKRAFDRKGRTVTYNFSANINSEEFTLGKTDGPRDKVSRKWQPNYILSYAESFFDQKFGLLLSASHAYSYTEQITSSVGYNATPLPTIDPRPLVVRQIDMKDGPKFIIKDALLLTADWKVTPRLTFSLNASYSYFEGEFWNRNFQWTAANDNANATVANGRASVGGDGVNTIIATRVASGSTPTSKNNTVASMALAGGGAAKLTYTRQYAPRFEYKFGPLTVDGAMAYSVAKNNYEALERGFSSGESGSIASSFTAERAGQGAWEWTIRQTSGADWFNHANYTSTDGRAGATRVNNDDRTWITEKWTGTANVRYVLPWLKKLPTVVKFGGKWDEEMRDNNDHNAWAVWSYVGPGGNTATYNPATETWTNTAWGNWSNLGPQYISANPFEMGKTNALTVFNINGVQGMPQRPSRNAMAELFQAHPEQFVNTSTVENYYTSWYANKRDFTQTITAGYGQADMRLTSKLNARFGVRFEQTENKLKEFNPLTAEQMFKSSPFASQFTRTIRNNADGTTTEIYNPARATSISGINYQYGSQPRITRTSKYHNYFPSLLLKYNVLRNFEWQAGYNKSIGRPSINAITGLWSVDETNQRVSAPNPNLEPEHHKRVMTRLAYYFQGQSPGQLTLMLSRTQFTNTLVQYDYTAAEFGVTDPDFDGYTFRSQDNISDRVTYTNNLSFGYRQTLGFLPSEYLRGITVFANYDRTYGTVDGGTTVLLFRRANMSPHRVSGGLNYRLRKFSSGLNFIWLDDRPESGTYGRYTRSTTRFDLTLGYSFNRRFELFVQGRNITNDPDMWMQSPPGTQEGKNGHLRSMESYGANWVFGVKGQF